jgi:hypothetical protein
MALLEDLLLPYISQRQVVLSHAGVWSGFRAVQDERTIPGQMMCGSFEMDLWAGLPGVSAGTERQQIIVDDI